MSNRSLIHSPFPSSVLSLSLYSQALYYVLTFPALRNAYEALFEIVKNTETFQMLISG